MSEFRYLTFMFAVVSEQLMAKINGFAWLKTGKGGMKNIYANRVILSIKKKSPIRWFLCIQCGNMFTLSPLEQFWRQRKSAFYSRKRHTCVLRGHCAKKWGRISSLPHFSIAQRGLDSVDISEINRKHLREWSGTLKKSKNRRFIFWLTLCCISISHS